MGTEFQKGDHVQGNSETGKCRAMSSKSIIWTSNPRVTRIHTTATNRQYAIKSDKTNYDVAHKGSSLRKII